MLGNTAIWSEYISNSGIVEKKKKEDYTNYQNKVTFFSLHSMQI